MCVYVLGVAQVIILKKGPLKEEKREEVRTAGGREGKLWWFK